MHTFNMPVPPATAALTVILPCLQVEHVTFVGADEMIASVPVEKVYNPYGDVLLAYSMNGEPIPQDHGAPVRAIVPGHVGVRAPHNAQTVHRRLY